jgi:vitamin B12 transporter
MWRSKMRSKTAVLTAILALPAPVVLAQVAELPEIVISAHQVPLDANRVGSANTVLHGDELRARGVATLAEALRSVPGVAVNASGSRGGKTDIRIRGAEANHLQVIIDDVPVLNLSDLGFDFADFQIDDIERIEVIRGPQSGIYGSAAHAGVIAIYTKSGRGLTKPELTARAEIGSRLTNNESVTVRGAHGPFYGAFSAQHFYTRGHNISRFGSERDPHRAYTLGGKVGVDVTENLNIEGTFRTQRRAAQLDGGDPIFSVPIADAYAYDTFENISARVAATHTAADGRFMQRLAAFTNRQDYDHIDTSGFPPYATRSRLDGADYKASYRYDLGATRNTTAVMLDYRQEYFSDSNGVDAERSRRGFAAEQIVDLPSGLTLSGAVRRDFNELFADATTWRLAASQRFTVSGTRLHASIGKGITNPSFYELFSTFQTFVPNPALRPESSVGWDIGWEQTWLDGTFITDVTYFSSRFRDKIGTITLVPGGFPPPPVVQAVNLTGVSPRQGVEVTAKYNPSPLFSFEATYTYTDAELPTGLPEIRRPHHAGSVSATLRSQDQRSHLTVTAIHNGVVRDDTFGLPGIVDMPAYTVVNAIWSYDLTPDTTFYVRGDNIFDKRYEEVFGYRAMPATYFAGLRMKLGGE